MPDQKQIKDQTRARMARTGESYMTARRVVIGELGGQGPGEEGGSPESTGTAEPVWMPPLTSVFKPNHEAVKRLLPEVAEVEWTFFAINGENRYDPHLVQEAKLRFSNGRVLVVPGSPLWKFRAMVLPGLGTRNDYHHENPYSEDSAEGLARRIRAAHDACCIKGDPIGERRPISITHNLETGMIVPKYRPFLSKDSIAFLRAATSAVGESTQGDFLADLRGLVEKETSRPVFDLGEFKDLGNGMLGRVPTESPWPDLNSVSFRQFLGMLSRDQQEDSPAQLTMQQKFSAIVLRLADALCEKVAAYARQANPDHYAKAARELGCKAKHPRAATFCQALAASDDRNLVSDGLWTLWDKRLQSMSLGEILATRPVAQRMTTRLPRPWGEGYVVDIFDLIRERATYTAKIGAELRQEFVLGMFRLMAESVAKTDLSNGRALFLFLRVITGGDGINHPDHTVEIVEVSQNCMGIYHDTPDAALAAAKEVLKIMLNERHGIFDFRAGMPVPGGMKPAALFTWEWGAVKFDFGQVPLDPARMAMLTSDSRF